MGKRATTSGKDPYDELTSQGWNPVEFGGAGFKSTLNISEPSIRFSKYAATIFLSGWKEGDQVDVLSNGSRLMLVENPEGSKTLKRPAKQKTDDRLQFYCKSMTSKMNIKTNTTFPLKKQKVGKHSAYVIDLK
jgi:hypothetical protein